MWPFRRRKTEERSIDSLPWIAGGSSSSVISQDRALSLAPLFSAVRLIASSVSTLPVQAYRRVGNQRQPLNKLPVLFEDLRNTGQLVPWVSRCVTSLATRGNTYGLIVSRDGFQFPTQIVWLDPNRVMCDERNPVRPVWYIDGRQVNPEDIVHIPWFPQAGKVVSLSPVGNFATTMGVGLQALEYGEGWFQSGGFPPGTFQNTAIPEIPPESADRMGALLRNAMRNRKPLVYGKDWKYDSVTVPPEEAQFIETLKMNANQIASIYGVPPHWIGGEAPAGLHYSTEEQDSIHFVMFGLRPWLVLLESAFSALLPDRQFIRFNADALIRADLRTRHEVYRIDRETGIRSADEIRALEDLPPLPDGQGEDFTPKWAKAETEPQQEENDMPLNGSRRWQIPA